MFFNKYVNAYHHDCHYGNFLYHLIEPGGYFHYNIYGTDYYIENLGYLWVIWDYGLIVPYYNSYEINKNKFGSYNNKILPITNDYTRFMSSLISVLDDKHIYLTDVLSNFLTSYRTITSVDSIKSFSIQLLDILNTYSTTFKKTINTNHTKVINKIPYIIK